MSKIKKRINILWAPKVVYLIKFFFMTFCTLSLSGDFESTISVEIEAVAKEVKEKLLKQEKEIFQSYPVTSDDIDHYDDLSSKGTERVDRGLQLSEGVAYSLAFVHFEKIENKIYLRKELIFKIIEKSIHELEQSGHVSIYEELRLMGDIKNHEGEKWAELPEKIYYLIRIEVQKIVMNGFKNALKKIESIDYSSELLDTIVDGVFIQVSVRDLYLKRLEELVMARTSFTFGQLLLDNRVSKHLKKRGRHNKELPEYIQKLEYKKYGKEFLLKFGKSSKIACYTLLKNRNN